MNLQRSIFNIIFLVAMCSSFYGKAQMVIGTDTLYGNEWINYEQSYFKIKVAETGIYKITQAELADAGFFTGTDIPEGSQFNLLRLGESVPIFTSTSGIFGSDDYVEFYGKKNEGEIDAFLYENPDYQVNPRYSLFTDTAIYYLTWNQTSNNPRITEVVNDLNSPPQKESSCFVKKSFEFHTRHLLGKSYVASSDISAKYDLGEGYTRHTLSANQTFNIATRNKINSGKATVQVQLQIADGSHALSLDLNAKNFVKDSFTNWAVKNYEFEVSGTDLVSSGNNKLTITGATPATDRFSVSNISILYPNSFDFENKSYFEFETEGIGAAQYLEITNFKTDGTVPVLYDLSAGNRITCILENNKVKALLPPFLGTRKLVLRNESENKAINGISKATFVDFSAINGDYIILSNSRLFDDGTGKNYVQEYADYRSSADGGNYKSVVVDVNQVYDQFGYGIERHEQAIRNFIHWSIPRWNPRLLFIIGKGVYYKTMRSSAADWQEFDMVPSFGYPSSDNLLAAGHASNIPKIPVGRIAAYKPDMVRQYLEKVKELEAAQRNTPQTIADRAWMKNILHLGGGDIDIQNFIKNELGNLEQIAQNGAFGANVFSLFKNSTDVIQQATSQDVIEFINSGVSLITFFGHSAPNTLDFDIGDPDRYQNAGKYPFIYAMGCNTNRLFESRKTLSEEYVFVEKKGAITFIGSTATTSLSNLTIYGKEFYKKINDLYGKPIGEIMQAVVKDYPSGGFWGELVQNNLMLHGDPALKINPHPTPDFIVNLEKTKTNPAFVNAQDDSFSLDLTLTNIGRAISDSMNILINHRLPNEELIPVDTLKKVPVPGYELTRQISIPLNEENLLGENNLEITLDYDNQIVENPGTAENNNQAEIPFIVTSNSALPIYPPEFSIVNDPETVMLKASTANVFSKSTKYYFQIDTSAFFDSPVLQNSIIENSGGLMTWKPDLLLGNKLVYYWRVSIDSIETKGLGFDWVESSFIVDTDLENGWNQSERFQKNKNNFNSIFQNSDQLLEFDTSSIEFNITNSAIRSDFGSTAILMRINGFKIGDAYPCPGKSVEALHIGVMDPKTLYWKFVDFPVNTNCWAPNAYYMIQSINDISDRERVISFLRDSIKPDEYVVMFSATRETQTLFTEEWAEDSISLGTNIFQLLEEQGAEKIRNIAKKETPFIFIYQKDNPNWSGRREFVADTKTEIIQTTTIFQGRQSSGTLTSLPIGPSKSWKSLSWKMIDEEIHDLAAIDIFGITKDGHDSLLQTNIQLSDTTLSHINAEEFPFLKLRLNLTDSINFTAPQLDYWRVFYDGYPEMALNPSSSFEFLADTLQEGEELKLRLAVENISEIKTDSLLVKFLVKDKANNEQVQLKRYGAVPEGDSLIVAFETDTRGMSGKNLLTIEANPNDDQPEQFHFNNIGVLEFFVEKDKRNPLLDVTFDGERIVNGDIISPTPEIMIELKDENQFLALDDTTGFEIGLQLPNQTDYINIPIGSPEIEFVPANSNDLENNHAKIYYRPQFLEDGDYKLRVNGKDATGNTSGTTAYEVVFKIINKSMISNMVNYPNPFSNSTRFLYTLTGSETPANFKIQILTVSGRIVREISQAEFGMMKIGTHLSDYIWDGTDEFGEPLANGVYLYRVTAQNTAGEDIERFDSGADQFFTRNYGKMMLIR